ncbi:hypothetical protein AVEN_209221-1 [Araneus ventricosus]|uniref:CCHC-type domain-containing protein n=1 Tax=Araneus ventricosus TaxID=182803 RepID=A0A4Y2FF82_ARAVE|nr:hypothetical protein AVEN_258821-1 [Araneus ventricosus]GBM39481.1 hypothetical protein AVEN_54169-1 [Araneus ventricosus]GBM39561.1 hypothetical protein AVEN_164177-1 [Araneus ventricosus]GBM39587.1 hypothetical protein AVEN_209221-1 [Araneus ventricosus]
MADNADLLALLAEMKKSMEKGQEEMKDRMEKGQEEMRKGEEEMKNQIQSHVESKVGEIKDHVNSCIEKIEEDVQSVKREIGEVKGEVERKIEEVEDKVQGKIEEMEDKVQGKIEEVKEKVQVKIGDLEKRLSELEDRPINFPANPDLTYSRPTVKSLTFDGQTSWTVFKTQFDVVSSANGWNNRVKASQLVASLRGSAAEVLQGIPSDKLTDLMTIQNALEARFGDSHLTQFYRTELKTRRQKPGESLQALAADVKRLMSLAYAECPMDVQESLAVQFFVDAIRDEDTQLRTRLMDFTDLKSALAYSMKCETSKIASKVSMHARPIRIEDNAGRRKDEKFESLLGALEKFLEILAAGKKSAPRRNPNVTCWRCYKRGHVQLECPSDSAPRRNPNVTCWICYKKGHVQRECPSDNASRRNPNATCWKCNKKGHLQNECQQITSINHHKETCHGSDKALSRRSFVESYEHDLNSDKKFGTETDISVRALRMTTENTWPVSEIQKAQLEDPDIRPILEKKLKSADRPSRQEIAQENPATKRYWALWDSLHLKDGVLYRKWENDDGSSCQWQLILPRSRIQEVLQETHDSSSGGHFGIMKTLRRIRERFYWDRLRADVEKWCRECQICRARKRLKTEDGKSVTGWISAEKLSDRTPSFPCGILFGRPEDTPSSPNEDLKKLGARLESVQTSDRERVKLSRVRKKTHYDSGATEHHFKKGDLVWMYNPKRRRGLSPKLQQNWEGPYTIVKKLNDVIYRVQRSPNAKPKVIHINRLTPYRATDHSSV